MSEIIVIFRKDAIGDCFAFFPNCLPMTRAFSVPPTSVSGNTAPPTTTCASPEATLPQQSSMPTCSRNWSGEDTT